MRLKEIVGRNLYATRGRGQITKDYDIVQLVFKMQEELDELIDSIKDDGTFDEKELADVMLTGHTGAKFLGVDMLKVMEEKMLFNEKRTD